MAKIKIQDKIIMGIIIVLIILHFFLPFIKDIDGLHNAYFALKYTSLHWGFYYFYIMVVALILGLIVFILVCQKEYRKYYRWAIWSWFICIIIMSVTALPLEDFLNNNPNLKMKSDADPTSIFIVSLFTFIIIMLIHVLTGMSEKEQSNKKLSSNQKFESFIKNKKILLESTVYSGAKWYYIFTGAKPHKLVMTKNEIVISTDENYLALPYSSIKDIKKNFGGWLNGGIQSSFRIYMKNGILYRVMWTTEGGTLSNYNQTMLLYEKVYKIWNGETLEIESKENVKVSYGAYLRYLVYSSLVYSAIAIAKNLVFTIMAFVGIGLTEYIIKNKSKIKKLIKL